MPVCRVHDQAIFLVCLQATALGLRTVTAGAFEDNEVKRAAVLPESQDPVYLLSVGLMPVERK